MRKFVLLFLLFSFTVHADTYNKSIRFDVVVNNSTHKIYRSEILGEKGLNTLYKHLKKNSLSYPKTIIYMNKNGYGGYGTLFDKRALEEFKLQKKFNYVFFHSFDYSYRTYLDGHYPYNPEKSIDKSKYLNSDAKKYFDFEEDEIADGGVDAFIRIMNIVLDPMMQPVLFHCYGGRHRTGMVAMMIRYLQGGDWISGKKIEKKIEGKYFYLNPAEYEYYNFSKPISRADNILFIRDFYMSEPIIQEWRNKL